MTAKRRIFTTTTRDKHLEQEGLEIKERLLERIRSEGYEPQRFFREGLPKNMSWSFSNVCSVMRKCCGAVVLGLPRWTLQCGSETIVMPSEFNHYEGAVAHACGLPVLTIALDAIPNSAVFWRGGDEVILTMQSAIRRFVERQL
jgi:hypothetical protein